jgi:hypothetical protein
MLGKLNRAAGLRRAPGLSSTMNRPGGYRKAPVLPGVQRFCELAFYLPDHLPARTGNLLAAGGERNALWNDAREAGLPARVGTGRPVYVPGSRRLVFTPEQAPVPGEA